MLALLAALAVAAPIDVPIRRLEVGLVLVPVELGTGETMTFILDTGAGITVVTPETAARLALPAEGRSVTAKAVGGTFAVRIVDLPHLAVGGMAFDGLPVAIVDLGAVAGHLGEPVDGILGRDFFERADVSLDLAHDRLALYAPGAFDPADDALGRVPFRMAKSGVLRVHAHLGGVPVRAVLDIGADSNVTNATTAARAAGIDTADASAMLGADGNPVPLHGATFASLAIGDVELDPPRFGVCTDRDGRTLLDGAGRRAHLGIDIVEDRVLVLSYAERAIWLSREAIR